MRTLLPAILLMIVMDASHAQTAVKLCDLLRNPEKYSGQQIEVRATFSYGFEWQDFFCLDCLDRRGVWLRLPVDLDDKSEKAFKKMPKGSGIVNVTVVGTFHSGGSYGHSNRYRYDQPNPKT